MHHKIKKLFPKIKIHKQKVQKFIVKCYSIILVIFPSPTVLPLSRIIKLMPFSIAAGLINSTLKSTSSPGPTDLFSGKIIVPVTLAVQIINCG